MSVPNFFTVVDLVFGTGSHDITTHDGCGRFLEACAREIHRSDPAFGHLRKSGAQNQYNGHAVDNLLYKGTGQAIDIVIESATDKARIAWQVEEIARYTDADWFAPVDVAPPVEPPVDPPPPPPIDPPAPELVLAALTRIEMQQHALAAQQTADTEAILARITQVVEDLEATAAKYLPMFDALLRMRT